MQLYYRVALTVTGAVLASLVPLRSAAQFVEPPPPPAYALRHVTLVTPDGTTRSGVTIVIRGRLIESIAADSAVPPDAKLLDGDSLMVYPGLVDAQGSARYEFPEPDDDRERVESWDPPRAVQSFMPHRRVVDHLAATGGDMGADRKKGVVAAAVHPDGRLMPGRGALLLFRIDAETPSGLVLDPALGPLLSFRGAQGVYPSQHFAVVAFMRQTFEDVRHEAAVETAYRRDPRGMTVPVWDPDFAVLRDALTGGKPVFFAADGAEDIRQVVALAQEYGFRPYIVGGNEAWKTADLLKASNIPVLVSLDFPKPDRWDPAKDTVVAGLDAAVAREKTRLQEIYANAGRLAAAGVPFALTSGGGKADLREGARTAVEHGLDEAAALRALTATPAELLGMPDLVRVEPGMPANLVVTDKPLFEDKAAVVYTFVEGGLEMGARTRAGGDDVAGEPASIGGEWDMETAVMGESRRGKLTIEQSGSEFSGAVTVPEATLRIENGTISGDKISFTIQFDAGGQMIEVNYTGTVTGNAMSGDVSMEFGTGTWKATRAGTPGEGA